MNEPDMIISSNELKALSSETRTEILKLLNERKYTLAELSKIKKVSAPSMKQQLKVLEENQLIYQLDEGRKWKYYSLSKKGKQLLESRKKPIHVTLILSASIILLVLTGIVFYSNTLLYSGISNQAMILSSQTDSIESEMVMQIQKDSSQIRNEIHEQIPIDLSYLNLNFIIAVILSLIIGYYLRQKLKEEYIR